MFGEKIRVKDYFIIFSQVNKWLNWLEEAESDSEEEDE